MNLPSIFNFQESMLGQTFVSELLKVNDEIKEYGLILTREDIQLIIQARSRVLKNYGRIELSFEVTKKLIETFSASPFINSENFVDIISELQEGFYFLKNETEDRISDIEVIKIMKELFENTCEGSIELLYSHLEVYSRGFRGSLG